MKANSLAFRLFVGALIWISGALTVSGFMLARIFDNHVAETFDRRVLVLLESLIAVTEVAETGGRPVLKRKPGEPRFDIPYSGWYYEIQAPNGVVLRSRSLWDASLPPSGPPVRRLRRFEAAGPEGQRLRVIERGVSVPGPDREEYVFRFSVAGDLAQIAEETKPFNKTLGWSLGILWFGLLVASVMQVQYGLHPLRRIRRGLADIRNGRTRRLEGRFPAEVTPLADELNAHLGHIETVVERARTHVGNLAHSLKTPLSVLTNEAAASTGPLAETVARQTRIMSRRVDHYLVRARTAALGNVLGSRAAVAPALDDLARTLTRIHAEKDLSIVCGADATLGFRGDRQDLEEMAGNLMDNACKWARRTVRATARRDGGRLVITIEDDGSGLAADQREVALSRGERLDESVPGTGLGLSIVQEIAGLYGGRLELGDSELGGLRATIDLPLAESE